MQLSSLIAPREVIRIFQNCGIRNSAQGILNPSSIDKKNPESTAWNPESRTVSDSLSWRGGLNPFTAK